MTLIITELSEFGIVMVADSAITYEQAVPSGETYHRVLNGAQKLWAIPNLNAGISMWGRGSIPTAVGPVDTDIWAYDFIARRKDLVTIDAFAKALTKELQDSVGNDKSPLGFHLAGYVEQNGKRLPTFYHVRNVEGDFRGYEFHDFIPGQDISPRAFEKGAIYETRNGSYGAYAALTNAVNFALPGIINATGITMPAPSLDGRATYLTAWVKFVSDLYASSGMLRTVGGSIASLGITPKGTIISYPPR